MKVNFNIKLKEFNGTDATEEKKVKDGEKIVVKQVPVIIRDIVAQALYNGGGIKRSESIEETNENRFKAYRLCQKIIAASEEIDLSPEELVMIKQAATIFPAAGVYAQIVELVDPK